MHGDHGDGRVEVGDVDGRRPALVGDRGRQPAWCRSPASATRPRSRLHRGSAAAPRCGTGSARRTRAGRGPPPAAPSPRPGPPRRRPGSRPSTRPGPPAPGGRSGSGRTGSRSSGVRAGSRSVVRGRPPPRRSHRRRRPSAPLARDRDGRRARSPTRTAESAAPGAAASVKARPSPSCPTRPAASGPAQPQRPQRDRRRHDRHRPRRGRVREVVPWPQSSARGDATSRALRPTATLVPVSSDPGPERPPPALPGRTNARAVTRPGVRGAAGQRVSSRGPPSWPRRAWRSPRSTCSCRA